MFRLDRDAPELARLVPGEEEHAPGPFRVPFEHGGAILPQLFANLAYRGGDEPIVHLEADLRDVVAWANSAGQRWAFTLSNAGAYYFEDRCSLDALDEINLEAVFASRWAGPGIPSLLKDGKQAEFLMERRFPWHLVERIGTRSAEVARQAIAALQGQAHRPHVEIRKDW